jgi:hypothetical protein
MYTAKLAVKKFGRRKVHGIRSRAKAAAGVAATHMINRPARRQVFPCDSPKKQSGAVTDLNMKRRQELNRITLCSGNLYLT